MLKCSLYRWHWVRSIFFVSAITWLRRWTLVLFSSIEKTSLCACRTQLRCRVYMRWTLKDAPAWLIGVSYSFSRLTVLTVWFISLFWEVCYFGISNSLPAVDFNFDFFQGISLYRFMLVNWFFEIKKLFNHPQSISNFKFKVFEVNGSKELWPIVNRWNCAV